VATRRAVRPSSCDASQALHRACNFAARRCRPGSDGSRELIGGSHGRTISPCDLGCASHPTMLQAYLRC